MTPEQKSHLIALSHAHRQNTAPAQPFNPRMLHCISPRAQRAMAKALKGGQSK